MQLAQQLIMPPQRNAINVTVSALPVMGLEQPDVEAVFQATISQEQHVSDVTAIVKFVMEQGIPDAVSAITDIIST